MWNDWIYNIRGYVTVEITGPFPERLINLCIKKNISLWEVHRKGEVITFNISTEGFRLLPKMVKKTGSRVHIKEKHGLPFFLRRYRARHFFIPGFLIFLVLLMQLSSFVWVVEPVGNEKMSREEVMEILRSAGLYPGVKKSAVDPVKLKREVLLATDEIVWVWADIRGVKAYVNLKESTPKPDMVPTNIPANIVASYDGVIESVTTREGQPMVEVGNTVAKGELLISGVVENEKGYTRLVHSLGEVRARTWVEKSSEISLQKEIRTPTGRDKTRYRMKILNFSINLFGNSRNIYENYDKITSTKRVTLFGWQLPIEIQTINFKEMAVETVPLHEAEAKKEVAAVLLREAMIDLSDAEILEQTVEAEPCGQNRIKVTLRIEASRVIGETVPIGEEKLYGNRTD